MKTVKNNLKLGFSVNDLGGFSFELYPIFNGVVNIKPFFVSEKPVKAEQ